MQIDNKPHVIIGLGKTGLSCVRFLAKRKINIAVVDSRPNPPGLKELREEFPNVKISLGSFDNELIKSADALVVSPGISLKTPIIAKQIACGIPAIGDIELFATHAKAPIIAITGSNGKSTVTTLVGEMAKDAGINVRVGGNLGTPALDLITESEPDLYVLELSSFQLETTYSLHATAAVVLNVSPDHMDRYDSLGDYRLAKLQIYDNAKNCIINRDEMKTYDGYAFTGKITSFGLNSAADGEFGYNTGFLTYGNERLIANSELKIKGRHQIANALAALALGQAVNIPVASMINTLRNFRGLEHRCRWVRNIAGVDWYNDSKGTNIGATQAAITGLGSEIKGKIVLIAGGQGKGADFTELLPTVKQFVSALVLIGQDAKIIAAALKDACEIVFADSMEEAVQKAKTHAKQNDAVLLSPACASFDMFNNFEHRGAAFENIVNGLQ